MVINKIYELPILSSLIDNNLHVCGNSSLLGNNLYLCENGFDATLIFSYYDDNKIEITIELKFGSVLCYKFTSERYTEDLLDAYDTVVQIDDSDWLIEMKKRDERDFKFWHPKHFAIFFDGVGLYQFIARDFEVVKRVG